ncbi:hypothetical protein QCA50_012307 [Cerrena zonata]|uniref:Uncharacterized protein n=1 Tax=Cerrena zonata TaxID=2478898 RepID=A0AAW0FSQ7_9APHY
MLLSHCCPPCGHLKLFSQPRLSDCSIPQPYLQGDDRREVFCVIIRHWIFGMFLRKRAIFSPRNEFRYLDITRPLGGGYIHLYMLSLALTPAAPSQTIRAI